MNTALRPHRVLLVEDSAADVFLLETSIEFTETPMQLRVAQDGLDALQQLEEALREGEVPELVLLDLNMPRMNGFEVLEALQRRPECQGLPVVVLTTSASPLDRERALALGARAYITKPHSFEGMEGLLAALHDALQGRRSWASVSP